MTEYIEDGTVEKETMRPIQKVDVIIPHYGKDELVRKCLESFEETPLINTVQVIDNNKNNRGFTKAVNEGLRVSLEDKSSKYVAIVNNDTTFISGQQPFYSLVKRMEEDASLAIVGPTIVSADNRDAIIHAGGLQCFPNGIHKSGLISLGNYRSPSYEKWLSFVVVLMRKECIFKVGMLDEKMWLICSDSDWCYRARYAGYRCGFEPGETWDHQVGESGGPTSEWSYKVQRRDMLAFHRKWVEPAGLFVQLDREVLPELAP